ncbi:MAG: hypothetical protein IBJ10_04350 [Phycisphaerales bacterium]|nr:hypothetical protein [Phycisphaerales bacterium]
MRKAALDTSIPRVQTADFSCPLGVYPTDPSSFKPLPGYHWAFEASDGDEEHDQWERWPDRYMYDVVVTHARVDALLRCLIALLPGRCYPILDVLGRDIYREVDPYIAYDAVGIERFIDGLRRRREWLLEDGLVGFGAMSLEPFVYIYVDEHKILTLRVEPSLKDRAERILAAFDLAALPEPQGIDSFEHEHRTALAPPEEGAEGEGALATQEDIVEELIERWRLTLNVDAEGNVDDQGRDLGATPWRCVVALRNEQDDEVCRAEVYLVAPSLAEAERIAIEALDRDPDADDACVLFADRLSPEEFASAVGPKADAAIGNPGPYAVRALKR